MNGTIVEVKSEDRATPLLEQLTRQLGEAWRGKIAAAAARGVQDTVRTHLSGLGTGRHATAEKLGAHPTNAIRRAAEGMSVRQEGATAAVVIPSPIFWRAFRDVQIEPRNAKALAIPVAAAAYDKAPRSFPDLFVWSRHRKTDGPDDKGAAFLARRKGEGLQLLYLLWRGRIVQRQDRSLLPDDAQLADAGRKGVSAWLEGFLRRRAKGTAPGTSTPVPAE